MFACYLAKLATLSLPSVAVVVVNMHSQSVERLSYRQLLVCIYMAVVVAQE